MTPPQRLSTLVSLAGAPLEEIALAIAAEFKPVDAARARERLDVLASRLDRGLLDDPKLRARDLIDKLSIVLPLHPRLCRGHEVGLRRLRSRLN